MIPATDTPETLPTGKPTISPKPRATAATTGREPIDRVIEALRRRGFDPHQTGTGKWESICPVHRGSRRNLSIAEGSDGTVLLNCHHIDETGGKCPTDAIVKALDLRMRDLFPPMPGGNGNGNGKPGSNGKPKGSGKPEGFDSPRDAAAFLARKLKTEPSAPWIYRDADGTAYAVVYRFDAPDGKTYRPVSLDLATGRWRLKDPARWLPYHVADIAGAERVYFFEGEKIADLARGLGLVATTTAHGAKSPHKTDLAALVGKEVVILPDNDRAGEGYASALLGLLGKLRPRPTVRIVRLPDLADGEDLEQWLERIPDTWDDEQTRSEIEALAAAAPVESLAEAIVVETGAADDDGGEVLDRWPKIDPRAFHGIAGEIVAKADPHTEADRVAVLLQLLVGIANIIGRGPHFVVGATRHYLNLFMLLIGLTSAGRKGSSWDVVRWILQSLDPDWADNRIQSGLVSGEGLIHHVRDPETTPCHTKAKGAKVTEETVDPGVTDKRLLIIETEFSRTLKAMSREANTLSDVLRQAWDSGTLRVLAKHKPAKATGAHVSIVGHSTPADIRRHLTKTDSENGFANRFLWVNVRRSKELPEGGNIAAVNWDTTRAELSGLISRARFVGEMTRDQTAAEMWREVYSDLLAEKPGLFGAVTSRAVPQTVRLSCVFALLDGSHIVRPEHLTAALALWQYCEDSARFIFGDSSDDPARDKLLAALKAAKKGLTRWSITTDVFAGNKKGKEIAGMLSDLLTAGLIHRQTEPTGGRPAERWFFGRDPGTKKTKNTK